MFIVCTYCEMIDIQAQQIENKIQQLLTLFSDSSALVNSKQVNLGENVFTEVSSKISAVLNEIQKNHAYFNQYLLSNNVSRLCAQATNPSTYQSPVYNNQPVNTDNYLTFINVSQNCSDVDLLSLFKKTHLNLPTQSTIQYLDHFGNTLTYPFTSNRVKSENINKHTLNFFGTRIKFIYPCKFRKNTFNQPVDLNFKANYEQDANYNTSIAFQKSKLTDFVQELSEFKQKIACCYGDQYITMGDKAWAIGIENELLDFIGRTHSESEQIIQISQVFDAINKTIASIHTNEQFRIYKMNRPYGNGSGCTGSFMHIIVEDSEYIETADQALELLKLYTEINENNKNVYNFEIIVVGEPKKNSFVQILETVIPVIRMELEIDHYLSHQFKSIDSSYEYYAIPHTIDPFDQEVIQICSLVLPYNSYGVICSSIPVSQILAQNGIQYIVDIEKELYLTKNSEILFNYKYFLAQVGPEQIIYFNQFNKTELMFNNQKHFMQNINGFIRLILQIREIDTQQYTLISSVNLTNILFTFDQCAQQTSGYIFNSNRKYTVDCANPSQTVTNIFSNQQDNLEAVLLLSDATFNQLQTVKTYLGLGVQVGRMSRNNQSIILTDLSLSAECLKEIQDYIYNYPNDEDFTTKRFHLSQLICQQSKGNAVITENFTLLINTHQNFLFTDYIILTSQSVNDFFQLDSYNVLTSELQSILPLTDNHLQLLFTEGALVCKLYDKPDYLHKGITFGSQKSSEHFLKLQNIDGLLFEMIPKDNVTFNCTSQVFSNEIMKNFQMSSDYYINSFQVENHIRTFRADRLQYIIVIAVIITTCFTISTLTLC
ncbi:Hypothetical_protein [Hexamita inflata]|uniref:Hypothetical_protein n=1 Tax=Hexamita inflata TaxID=28002 RepID=A0AA86RTH9_9EUKA|nr:Hypothetical protein HINF_LOCUS65304 [Hexamita inflata]